MARVDGTNFKDVMTAADVPPGHSAEFHGAGGDDHLSGTVFGDALFGDDGDDELLGNAGDDFLRGGAGNDLILGGSGDDDISGGLGDDELFGGTGNDKIVATLGVDKVSGGDGNDDISVTGGDWFKFDQVDGGSGNDTIEVHGTKVLAFGGAGNDTIVADLANDTVLIGGAGSDRFVITDATVAPGRAAEIHGGDAAVALTSVAGVESIASVSALGDTSIDTLDLSELAGFGTLTVDLAAGTLRGANSALLATFDGIESVTGSAGRDVILGDGGSNAVDGGAGDDQIVGGSGDDILGGGAGEDILSGDGGNDVLTGGAGDDFLAGGGGDDGLFGGAGDDQLAGNSGADVLNGEAGDDTLDGGSSGDIVNGGAGRDTINGGTGDDIIYGDFYGDAVAADTLTGGSGADRFVFTDVANNVTTYNISSITGARVVTFITNIIDTITDFDTSGADHDTIDIAYLLDTRTNFNGSTFQQAVAGGYLYFVQHGTPGSADFGTRVMIDLDGSNNGNHNDTANNFAIADLKDVFATEMRADLFLV